MSILVDICGDEGNKYLNTGSSKQCLEKATVSYALAKGNFTFADLAAFKSKTAWDTARENKDIVVLYSVEQLENANAESTYYESRTLKAETKAARKGKIFTHHLGLCSHGALKSYENSGYNRVFEITEDGHVKGVRNDDGTIKGQLLSSFIVGIREDATLETVPTTKVELTFKDFNEFEQNGVITTPGFSITDYEGIYPLYFSLVSASASEIKVKATAGCEGLEVKNLALADFTLLDASGAAQAISGVTNTDNEYTLTGSFANGVLKTAVITKGTVVYEGEELSITV